MQGKFECRRILFYGRGLVETNASRCWSVKRQEDVQHIPAHFDFGRQGFTIVGCRRLSSVVVGCQWWLPSVFVLKQQSKRRGQAWPIFWCRYRRDFVAWMLPLQWVLSQSRPGCCTLVHVSLVIYRAVRISKHASLAVVVVVLWVLASAAVDVDCVLGEHGSAFKSLFSSMSRNWNENSAKRSNFRTQRRTTIRSIDIKNVEPKNRNVKNAFYEKKR